jgi:hypothetical protein
VLHAQKYFLYFNLKNRNNEKIIFFFIVPIFRHKGSELQRFTGKHFVPLNLCLFEPKKRKKLCYFEPLSLGFKKKFKGTKPQRFTGKHFVPLNLCHFATLNLNKKKPKFKKKRI